MSLSVTINSVTGTSNYDVWISNSCSPSATKLYIDTFDTGDIPFTFTVPSTYENGQFCVRLYDSSGCEICECYNELPSPSPSVTPSVTPTMTVTPTTTPTPTSTPPCSASTYYDGTFIANNFPYNVTYTLSGSLYNGKPQWTSPSNGTIRWNGFRWEIAGWAPSGVIFYNTNNTSDTPDTTSWVYQGCAPRQTCSVSFTSEGCGEPLGYTPTPTPTATQTPTVTPTPSITPSSPSLYSVIGDNFYSVRPTPDPICSLYTGNTVGVTTYYALVDETTFFACPTSYVVYEYVLGSFSPVTNGFIGRDPFGPYGGCWIEINNSGGTNGQVVGFGSCTGASCGSVGSGC